MKGRWDLLYVYIERVTMATSKEVHDSSGHLSRMPLLKQYIEECMNDVTGLVQDYNVVSVWRL